MLQWIATWQLATEQDSVLAQVDRERGGFAGNPPPPGGSPICRFPNQEPGGRGTSSKNVYQVNLYQGTCQIGDPPGQEGFLRSKYAHYWG